MTAALLIFAFTAGLVLSPAVGRLIHRIRKARAYNKERAAIQLLEGYGYTVDFKSKLGTDDTVATDMNPWLE